jgi:ribosomal protein S27E
MSSAFARAAPSLQQELGSAKALADGIGALPPAGLELVAAQPDATASATSRAASPINGGNSGTVAAQHAPGERRVAGRRLSASTRRDDVAMDKLNFFTRFAGAETAAAMEAHSRAWLVICPHCGHERSIWELGGIRSRLLLACPNCGKAGWHEVHKAADFPTMRVPAWGLVRLILSVVLCVLILVAVIVGVVLKLTGVV